MWRKVCSSLSLATPDMSRVFLLLGLSCLAGCTQYWAKPGGTALEFETVKARCETEAFQRFPPAMRTTLANPGYLVPMRTDCRPTPRGQDCFTTGGGIVPPTYSTMDLNSQPRSASYRSCLLTAGWQPARDKEEAEAITRMAPPFPSRTSAPGSPAR